MIIIVQTWILLSYLKGVSWAFLFIEDVDLCQNCILRAPAVADALTTGRGAVIERSAGGAGQDCL